MGGQRRGAEQCERLTPKSGEEQEMTPKSGEVQEMTLRSEEVQEADDEERGSATAAGGETGECKSVVERGKWGHRSSQHSCDRPRTRQPTRPDSPHAGKRARPERPFAQPMHGEEVCHTLVARG
jgi:hypothetical protein